MGGGGHRELSHRGIDAAPAPGSRRGSTPHPIRGPGDWAPRPDRANGRAARTGVRRAGRRTQDPTGQALRPIPVTRRNECPIHTGLPADRTPHPSQPPTGRHPSRTQDPTGQALRPSQAHPLIGRPVCRRFRLIGGPFGAEHTAGDAASVPAPRRVGLPADPMPRPRLDRRRARRPVTRQVVWLSAATICRHFSTSTAICASSASRVSNLAWPRTKARKSTATWRPYRSRPTRSMA